MAGTDPEFFPAGEGDLFKADVRLVQELAMPNTTSERPTFHFDPERVFDDADSEGQPYDWTTSPDSDDPKADVQVLCTVETEAGGFGDGVDEHPVGDFAGLVVSLTFFPEEWALVSDFTTVTISGSTYQRVRRLPTLAIGDVDLITVEVEAPDAKR